MKIFISVMVLLLSISSCNGQNKKHQKKESSKMNLSFIDNKKLNYSIVLMTCDTCVPIKNIGYRVVVTLTKKEKEIINKIDKATWLKLLSDSNKDFATNLILYSIYNKDAFILSKNDEQGEWKKYRKDEDLKFWTTELK